MTIVELGLTVTIMIVMWHTRRDYKDFIMIFLLGGHILVTALNQGIVSKILNNNVSAFLGYISYPMYVNQLIIQRFTRQYYLIYPFWSVTAIGIFTTVIYSLITSRLMKCFFKKWKFKIAAL